MNLHSSLRRMSRLGHASLLALTVTLGTALPGRAAPTIPNSSFEANAVFTTSPGYVSDNAAIAGWTANPVGRVGLNPGSFAPSTNAPFANNGAIPNGARVAFLQSAGATTTLSTTITGLAVGTTYLVKFRANQRSGSAAIGGPPVASFRINGGAAVSFNASPAVGGTNAYYTVSGIFTATATTAPLEISNTTSSDTTLLVDNFTITAPTAIQVTNINNDGPGSLRQALISAAASPAFNVITFAPALSGKAIELLSHFEVNDASGIVIDALSLPAGLVLDGGEVTRIFSLGATTVMSVRGLTLTDGNGTSTSDTFIDGPGGAIFNKGTLVMTRCTFFGNLSSSEGGGAIHSERHLELIQCTLSDNDSDASGGALSNIPLGVISLNHCTVSGNSAAGSGGAILNLHKLIVTNCIVADNSAPTGADIENSNSVSRLVLAGANVIENIHNGASGSTTGSIPIAESPELEDLANNGGSTPTRALRPTSPARNASTGSTVLTDQRGKPIAGPIVAGPRADIGAYEVQPGTFVMNTPSFSIAENGVKVSIIVNRIDGFEGTETVNLSTTPGSASAADFTALANETISFTDGDTTEGRFVNITNDALVEPNEFFTVLLSAPSEGATLGSPSSARVVIVDPSSLPPPATGDTVAPSAPVFTSPAANAQILMGSPLMITGTAADNKGVASVLVEFDLGDGAGFVFGIPADLGQPKAASTTWSTGITFSSSTNVTMRATATDLAGRVSPATTRSIRILHPLRVQLGGNGTVTSGFAPVSFRQLGLSHTITATPAPGAIFAGWTTNYPLDEIGLIPTDLEKPTLTFIHRPGLVLTAVFVSNAFFVANAGNYKALILPSSTEPDRDPPGSGPENGTASSNSTEGLFNLTLMPTAAFSGTITLDGAVFSFAGAFNHLLRARFGTSRSAKLFLPRVNQPSLVVQFKMDAGGMSGSVTAVDFRGIPIAVSRFSPQPAAFDGITRLAPAGLLGPGGANGRFSVVFDALPVTSQPDGFDERFYPQGHGIGTIIVSKNGTVSLTNCTLADGTTGITASTFLISNTICPLFVPLYSKRGFIRCSIDFDTSEPDSDLTDGNSGVLWSRPFINTHYYPEGWPEVISVALRGSKYTIRPGESVLRAADDQPLGDPNEPGGNAFLNFDDGQLSSPVLKVGDVAVNDAVTKVPFNDPTFTMSIARTTGLISGTFRHSDGNFLTYRAIIFQKGSDAGAYGFFLTKQPVPIDYTGESGGVSIVGAP